MSNLVTLNDTYWKLSDLKKELEKYPLKVHMEFLPDDCVSKRKFKKASKTPCGYCNDDVVSTIAVHLNRKHFSDTWVITCDLCTKKRKLLNRHLPSLRNHFSRCHKDQKRTREYFLELIERSKAKESKFKNLSNQSNLNLRVLPTNVENEDQKEVPPDAVADTEINIEKENSIEELQSTLPTFKIRLTRLEHMNLGYRFICNDTNDHLYKNCGPVSNNSESEHQCAYDGQTSNTDGYAAEAKKEVEGCDSPHRSLQDYGEKRNQESLYYCTRNYEYTNNECDSVEENATVNDRNRKKDDYYYVNDNEFTDCNHNQEEYVIENKNSGLENVNVCCDDALYDNNFHVTKSPSANVTRIIDMEASEDSLLICCICLENFWEKHVFVDHLEAHLIENCFSCSSCNFRTMEKSRLEDHVNKYHSYGMLASSSKKKFKPISNRLTIKKSHKDFTKSKYPCVFCDRTFPGKFKIKRHLLTHL